ncbi:MAG: nitroreductase family protein [Ardenticatenales bacterium]|nr:nitroreductase family protein [Ardenticatenales bacterium]
MQHHEPDPFGTLSQQILTRRSIRNFRAEQVPLALVDELLRLAGRAPSAHNRQPWRWVVVHTDEGKQRLAEEMGHEFHLDLRRDGVPEEKAAAMVARSHERIRGAAVVLIPCLTMSEMDCYSDGERQRCEWQMAVQSVALACGTLMLAAHARGLGSCWVCAPIFCVSTVQRSLALPTDWEPQGLITLGWPADEGRNREKKAIENLTLYR